MSHLVPRLSRILGYLCTAVADFMARRAWEPASVILGDRVYVPKLAPSPHRPVAPEVWRLLLTRLERLSRRFQRLVDGWRAGTLREPRKRHVAGQGAMPRALGLRLPRERGWINKRVDAAAQCAGLLHGFLQDREELPRFLAEVPRAARLLRPLCHALGLDMPQAHRLPRRVRPPRPAPVPIAPAQDRPLPRHVRAAARAWKKREA